MAHSKSSANPSARIGEINPGKGGINAKRATPSPFGPHRGNNATKGAEMDDVSKHILARNHKQHHTPLQNDTDAETFGALPANVNKGRNADHLPHDTNLLGIAHDPHDSMKGLKREFTFPPFSVFNARDGHWMARKRLWWKLGMTWEQGRSVFDPVLCELMYRWFCPPGGNVLDPFSGSCMGGVVAAHMGRRFTGIDINPATVETNRLQGSRICRACEHQPTWLNGDSAKMRDVLPDEYRADHIHSCPPYADLEVYSDNPNDVSTMPYDTFMVAYRRIILKASRVLNDNRFVTWVIGEIRDSKKKNGPYHGFVPDTIAAFEEAGLTYYNEFILVTAVGSLPLRTRRQFHATRKCGRTHQSVLVFLKGDARKASFKLNETMDADPGDSE